MDCLKVGSLILSLRKEKGLTQKQLADKMNISDKTVSKWERGNGCPDVSLLPELSSCLGVNIEKILSGDIGVNDKSGGNMKKTKFYVCPVCGNIITSAGAGEMSCCGRKLLALTATEADENHKMNIGQAEDDFYITFSHPMEKSHYIAFLAYLNTDKMMFVRLYPEQGGEARFPKMYGGYLYWYCTEHGLFYHKC